MQEDERKEIETMIAQAVLTKQEIKDDIIKPLLATMGAYHEGDLKLINADLHKILEQTTKHNQRMTKIEVAAIKEAAKIVELEKANLTYKIEHTEIPQRVRVLEDERLTAKGIKVWIAWSVGTATGVMGMFWILYQFFGDKI